ncbi:MAG: AAA family ATPase [Patescibacteria group bacterium]|nr:AAA family ATPase [Patescibacteria group bacterium]
MSLAVPENRFIFCPQCQGSGKVKGGTCPFCQGKGVHVLIAPYLFYWQRKISGDQIFVDKFLNILKNLVKIILILIVAWGGLILILRLLGQTDMAMTGQEFFQQQTQTELNNNLPVAVWLAFLVCLYFFYHRQHRQELILKNKVKKIDFKETATLPIWEDYLKIDEKNQIEISDSLSITAFKAVLKARDMAFKLDHQQILPLHLLASLLTFDDIQSIFTHLGINPKKVKDQVVYNLGRLSERDKEPLSMHLNLKVALLKSYFLAAERRAPQIELIDLMIGLLDVPSLAHEILTDLEVDKHKIKNVGVWIEVKNNLKNRSQRFQARKKLKSKKGMNKAMTAVITPYLDQFSQDLTALARADLLGYCVGRNDELNRIFQAIQSGGDSVVLVGNPGTGKTTIIEGIARLMVTEDVPPILQDKRLVSLSLSALISGGAGVGAVEERLRRIIYEIERAGNIVVFISDIHNAIGVSSTSGELDISEMLAEELAQKKFILIADTDPVNFQRYMENKALANVLEKISIDEPQGDKAIQILEAEASFLEARYNVFFSYDAIDQAVALSSRYIHDRFLPEKGVLLLEEAALYVRNIKGKKALVTGEDIAQLVSQKTKIPLTDISQQETQKLLNLEKQIHQRLINQTQAVEAVANALRRARAELRDQKRTVANLLFLGPTGVGKTELAKIVAEIYFNSEKNMVRLDMSEYQEKDSVKRMIGAPASGQGGVLTEAIKNNPFSLLLLDEIEKAHPDILNLFLQVMEDGRLTDTTGQTIDFTNVILIATSNAGAFYIQDAVKQNIDLNQVKEKLIAEELRSSFRPEFLNRFDDIILFRTLKQEEIQQIAKLMLKGVEKQLAEKGINLKITQATLEELAREGFDPKFGARPLRRVIQEKVQNNLAKYILEGKLQRRDLAILEPGGKIRVEKAQEI